MIYSNYDESAIDFFADKKSYGITMPAARNCMEQNMFISGIAESAMLTAFERIGESEKAYYESGFSYVEEGAIFDSIKEMFGKILEAIKEAYEKVIAWFAEKQAEVAKWFREKSVDRWFDKIDKISSGRNVDNSKKLCKSKIAKNGDGKAFLKDFSSLQSTASQKAKAGYTFAKSVCAGDTNTDDSSALKLEALKKIIGADSSKLGSTYGDILKNYKKHYVSEKEDDVTVGAAIGVKDELKKIVLAGTQKYYIKKCYNDEKKAINEIVRDLKKYSDKDDKSVKPKVARCKDITMVMDAVYRTDMEIIQVQFSDARKILSSLASYASTIAKKNDKEDNKASAMESAEFYML